MYPSPPYNHPKKIYESALKNRKYWSFAQTFHNRKAMACGENKKCGNAIQNDFIGQRL